MVARIPFPFLKPCAFEEHSEDIALIYAAKFRAEAAGEAAWMLHCIGSEDMTGAVRAVLARALRLAATELEAERKTPAERNTLESFT